MSKVKVWGKEIEYCRECNYCSQGNVCTLLGDELQFPYEEIYIDCPFSKSVSNIISDNFIFVHIGGKLNKDAQQIYEVSSKKLGDVEVLYTEYSKKCIIRHPNYTRDGSGDFEDYEVLFNGIINNPVELEFILKSIGVIE